jgi:hypothetical protein
MNEIHLPKLQKEKFVNESEDPESAYSKSNYRTLPINREIKHHFRRLSEDTMALLAANTG